MIRRKNILLLALLLLPMFIVTTNYLLVILPLESDIKRTATIEENIYKEFKNLSPYYKIKSTEINDEYVVKNMFYNISSEYHDIEQLWRVSNEWPNKTQLVEVQSPCIGKIMSLLSHAKIIQADLDQRGTQLKLLLTLEGNQQVIFKPKWYDKEEIVEGPVYAGKDRYNSEIIGFYLSLILKRPLCPLSVERQISLKQDILPVATKKLLDTCLVKNNRTCIYGKCFFCSINDTVCDDENSTLVGAVILNIKGSLKNHRSPWQRTYKKHKNAVWQEFPDNYCRLVKTKLSKKRLYDLIDLSIFDFLIQNGDRHHYETFDDTVLWLDNGKGLGNPYKHHVDILAPLYQCCMIRKTMYKNLLKLSGGKLTQQLLNMPNIQNLITAAHLKAIEERLLLIFATIEYCRNIKKANI